MKPTFWCSLVQEGVGYVGNCIVEAPTPTEAIKKARALKPDLKGEVMVWPCPNHPESRKEIERWGLDRVFDVRGEKGYKQIKNMTQQEEEATYKNGIGAHTACMDKKEGNENDKAQVDPGFHKR